MEATAKDRTPEQAPNTPEKQEKTLKPEAKEDLTDIPIEGSDTEDFSEEYEDYAETPGICDNDSDIYDLMAECNHGEWGD
ncbi:X protein [Potato yellow dwarf virus]|uniref:X protein n=1 Tax=constricta yellow dwarf virus TaxID=3020400 RepID=A0A1W6BQI1_9RHAB|nr:X protein [Potato yellow dwarf virus]ARJ54292.1 X protein [constricta yellow dwarf virus]